MVHIFGLQHLIYLTVSILVMAFVITFVVKKVKTEKQIKIIIKLIGFLLLCAIVWNRISIAIGRNDLKELLPDSFCGTTSLVLSLSTLFLKKDNKVLHGVAYLGLLGGMVTMVYPDFITQADSIFYPMTISGLLHHTIMTLLVLLMLITGYLKPSIKNWVILPLTISIYMTYGIFLITVIGVDDAMYIYTPILSGTILNWFVLGLLFIPVYTLFLFLWEYYRKKLNN